MKHLKLWLKYRLVCYFPVVWRLHPRGREGFGPYCARWKWVDKLIFWLDPV